MVVIRIIPSHEFKVMPWKNGGGTTAEIAIEPQGALLGSLDYLWRASLATIEKDGFFSIFPEIDRTLVPLEGATVALTFNNGPENLLKAYELVSFRGEDRVYCSIIPNDQASIAYDFNLMVRRGACEGQIVVVREAMEFKSVQDALVFAARGNVRFKSNGAYWSLRAGDAALIRSQDFVVVDGSSVAIVALFRPLGGEEIGRPNLSI